MASAPTDSPLPFDNHVAFDPAGDFPSFLQKVPARWAIYLLSDEHDRPVQLLSVKNLRASLNRRLSPAEAVAGSESRDPTPDNAPAEPASPVALTRRIDYRALVRNVHYRRVDSAFEADWLYFEIARKTFPRTYQALLGFRLAWFLHVNPDAGFPRYIKTQNLAIRTGSLLGPIEDKHGANRLVEEMEDAFDLCRYYAILVQAPHANACAYKEMGKCPAPCDGSISMPQYRRLMSMSLTVLQNPPDYINEQTARMGQAARELKFEIAAKIKLYISQLSKFRLGPYRHLNTLQNFRFLTVQRGPRVGTAKVYLILPGQVIELMCLRDEKFRPADVMRLALETANSPDEPITDTAAERIGLVSHHLFAPKSAAGTFLRLSHIDERQISRAYAAVQKRNEPAEITDEEGVLRELQAME